MPRKLCNEHHTNTNSSYDCEDDSHHAQDGHNGNDAQRNIYHPTHHRKDFDGHGGD